MTRIFKDSATLKESFRAKDFRIEKNLTAAKEMEMDEKAAKKVDEITCNGVPLVTCELVNWIFSDNQFITFLFNDVIAGQIFQYLPFNQILQLRLVSHDMSNIVENHSIWTTKRREFLNKILPSMSVMDDWIQYFYR